jgi:hypothetical protein
MQHRIRGTRVPCALLIAVLGSLALGACGSSSSVDAGSLLKQTFSGSHTINSGNLSFSLTLNPSGSTTLTSPITLSFGGPFQSRGKGQLPESNFNISVSAQGRTGSLGILSTGTSGFVTLRGTSYQLPATTFQKLESSFAGITSPTGGGSASSSALSRLGINPLHWLDNPTVVGSESVGGTDTTHIRANVNVAALLLDLNTFLQKASSLGVSGAGRIPSSLSAATRTRIAGEVKNPSFDVWTGTGDKTVRKLAINLAFPVTGQFSTLLGGLRSAALGINMQYANLNQPQTIAAPTAVRPFSEFTTKLRSFLQSVQGALGSSATGGAGSTGAATSGGLSKYTKCIQSAQGDVRKMQSCAPLLNGK